MTRAGGPTPRFERATDGNGHIIRGRGVSDTNLTLKLEILSQPNLTLDVQGYTGEESISALYCCMIFATTTASVTATSLVGERAKLTVTTACGEAITSGVLFGVWELDPTPTYERVLKFELRPRFVVTKLSSENRVFGPGQAVGVDDVVKQEVGRADISFPAEYNLDSYPKRSYIVQFDETDFAFMSRLCEQAGIFYYFKQASDGETIVFGDKNLAFTNVSFGGTSTIDYRHPAENNVARRPDESSLLSFEQRSAMMTKSVKVRDYNESVPRVVSGEKNAGTSSAFVGTVRLFGGNFADDGAGETLAKVRAEWLATAQVSYSGRSDAPELRAGMIFTVQNHPSLDGEYLVVKVTHSASRPAPIGFAALPGGGQAYQNTFDCIKSNVPYRPACATPRPAAQGLHTASVDGETWSGRAEIDGEGRYKLQLKFADEASARARGSDYVRKLEPYQGPRQTGLYFPLVAGTEVIVGYLNGDIDRPVVLGAVANPDWRNLVTSTDSLYNRIKSQSGTLFEIYDGPVPTTTTTTP